MRTLRLRLLVPLGIGLTLLLGLGGLVLHGTVRSALLAGLDETLLAKARAVASHVELGVAPALRARVEALGSAAFGEGGDPAARQELLDLAEEAFTVHVADRGRLDPAFPAGEDGAYYEIRLHDGSTLARSQSLGSARLELPQPLGEKKVYVDVVLPDGRAGRAVVSRRLDPAFPDETRQRAWARIRGSASLPALRVTLVVAGSRARVDALLRTLGRTLLGLLVVLVLGGALVALVLVLRGLAPLDDLRRQIEGLDPAALDQRVELRRPPGELIPVVDALNQRLDALEAAFDRERRTTAHIAHELRTPIAELRTLTEVALQFPDDADLTRQSLQQGHEAAVHMSRLVETVLRLARARSDAEARPERLEVAPLVAAAWEGLRGQAAARDQTLASDLAADLVVHADRDAVAALLANLLGNAVRHAPEGSTVRVTGRQADGRVLLEVANPCADLDDDDLDHLAEPFWRKDAARAASEQGGLGLALAKAWAEAAGIDLAFALGEDTFTASLRHRAGPPPTPGR